MKSIIILLLAISTYCKGQNSNWSVNKIQNYFTVNTYVVNTKMQNKDTTLIFIYPAVQINRNDEIGKFIKDKENRFQYLLVNRTKFENVYNSLYPDTIKIRDTRARDLTNNKAFITYLNETLKPLQTKDIKSELSYSKKELLDVASRFFFSDSIYADTTVSMHMCVGLNGMEDVNWKKDYTYLEAFCFEAIFYYLREGKMYDCEKNFKMIVEELKNEYLEKEKSMDGLLKYIQINTFKRMAKDKILTERLYDYYNLNKDNLNFSLKEN